jgi:exopolysaccharide biosynthesis polyprenyl glycosylphosphotransferase
MARPPVSRLLEPAPAGAVDAGAIAREPGRTPRLDARLVWLHEGRGYTLVRLATDLAALAAATAIADQLTPAPGSVGLYAFPLLVVLLLSLLRLYDPDAQLDLFDRAARVLGAIALAAVLDVGLLELVARPAADPALSIAEVGVAALLVSMPRATLAISRVAARRRGRSGRPTLIAGAGEIGARLERRLEQLPELGLVPVGFLDPDPDPEAATDRHHPVLGSLDDLDAAVAATGARHLLIAFLQEPDRRLRPLVRHCETLGMGVSLVPRLFDETTDRIELEHVGGLPVFAMRRIDPKGWQFGVKHALDRCGAALGLVVLSPLLLGIALAVKLSSRGPVLYRQGRVGRDGQAFEMLKFRSMRLPDDEDAPAAPAPGDGLAPGGVEGADRRTTIGRFMRRSSLDELPQLINVLRADMSIVGPRPERPEFVARFDGLVDRYEDRHRVKSGITGWAQVHGLRGKTPLEERVEWDNYYIQNWSLWLDFKTLVLTVGAVLRGAE